ncbi:histone-lysine N-methyltransferase PRDM16-like isoform X2 [Artemia franciscana]|uniref:histone-lysine N-methyltransferase PRDM16-like isoform X2 n=1 Tax=Artemia franciscana TaxID=6661 RepID=UPI0032DBF0DA
MLQRKNVRSIKLEQNQKIIPNFLKKHILYPDRSQLNGDGRLPLLKNEPVVSLTGRNQWDLGPMRNVHQTSHRTFDPAILDDLISNEHGDSNDFRSRLPPWNPHFVNAKTLSKTGVPGEEWRRQIEARRRMIAKRRERRRLTLFGKAEVADACMQTSRPSSSEIVQLPELDLRHENEKNLVTRPLSSDKRIHKEASFDETIVPVVKALRKCALETATQDILEEEELEQIKTRRKHFLESKIAEETNIRLLEVSVSSDSTIVSSINGSWIFHVNLANSQTSQNIQIACKDNFFFLYSIKDIKPGDELFTWFSFDFLMKYNVPATPAIETNEIEVTYMCDNCDVRFTSQNKLRIHQFLSCRSTSISDFWKAIKNNEAFEQPRPNPSLSVERSQMISPGAIEDYVTNFSGPRYGQRGHICIYCGKVYSRRYGLKIHIRTHTGYKPLECPVCQRNFGDPSNLNKHVRLHSNGYTPYRCRECNKVLVRKRDLERHLKTRHPNTKADDKSGL